ncbi:alpha/beta fold hydrolase [Peribacillus deserti]|uniref:Alpha/beta hydrolase n=1 Tax=Peribacillus deserti TaxID=673318 RepID=A0A2N5M5U0_9BACI|nr:alpha/beta hydrolase [Peribacillus deserti]PLT29731.1 alpha/beta hydrolase [Peribacillus deserti]
MHSIYKNEKAKERILNYYDAYLNELKVPIEKEYVQTRYGKTHMLISGPENGKPLFILQGGNCINPMTLAWFKPLLHEYRIYAPDTIGHPGYSDEIRLSAKDESFALWITDLTEHYNISASAFLGPSYGGGILLRLAAYAPEKIKCAILVAPAGLVLGSKIEMIKKILKPLLFYKISGSNKQLKKITDIMSNGNMKLLDEKIIGEIFRGVRLEQDMPKLSSRDELIEFVAPTMIVGGEKDIFFPGERLKEQAKRIIPNVVEFNISKGAHFSSNNELEQMNKKILGFLRYYYN